MLHESETASGFGFSNHVVDMARAKKMLRMFLSTEVDFVLNYTARGDSICSIATLWIQATVPAAELLECCILCNVQFYTTSAGYSGQDLMNHTETDIN